MEHPAPGPRRRDPSRPQARHGEKVKPCRECETFYAPTISQIKRNSWLCRPCKADYDSGWRDRRRAAGLRASGGVHDRSLETKHREALRMRLRRMDKSEIPKIRARLAVRRAMEASKLSRKPCGVCDNPKSQAHHDDYSRPLKVTWLCRKHHSEHHRAESSARNRR